VTIESHRRNVRDDAHVRRICGLRPELEATLGLVETHAATFDTSLENKVATVEANVAWRRDLEAQATESRERLLDARVFAASLELFRYVDEELALWRSDPDVVTPIAETLLLRLRGLLPAEPEQRFDAIATRLSAVPQALEQARATGQRTLTAVRPELTVRARDVIDGMPELLRAITDAAAAPTPSGRHLPPSLQASIQTAVTTAAGALDAHGEWLVSLPSAPPPLPGVTRFDEVLRLRGLDLTAHEVLDLGRTVAEGLRVEMQRVMRRAYKGMTAEGAVAAARKSVPHSLSEAIAWMRELVEQSRRFVHEQGHIPVPSPTADNQSERLHIDVMPAAFAPAGQAAVYLPPQPYAPRQDALLLVREPLGPQQEALRELSVADLETVVASLGFPGRHVQSVWQNRTTSIARRGALLGSVAGPASVWGQDMVAGWSLVAAEFMREQNFRHSPASRLMMLHHGFVAAVTAIVDVNLALGRASAESAAAFLVRRAGIRLPVARSIVRGLLARPTSGVSGLVGKVRIEQLRREAHRRWRDGYSDRRFFSLLMANGPVPLAYLFERLDEAPAAISDVDTVITTA
jgi:uncharacterized protein (DUF885 family)